MTYRVEFAGENAVLLIRAECFVEAYWKAVVWVQDLTGKVFKVCSVTKEDNENG